MYWAIVDNEKVEPAPKKKGRCPLCQGKVFPRCGDIRVWHWAHYKGENCDTWYEPETYWHLFWKKIFGKENAEIVIKKNDIWHTADIVTKENVVIKLKSSTIQKPEISEHEDFYGERMIWLINGIDFRESFFIRDYDKTYGEWGSKHDMTTNKTGKKRFYWGYPRRSWENVRRPVFIDFRTEYLFWVKIGMGTKEGIGKFFSKKEFITKYGGDFEYYFKKTHS